MKISVIIPCYNSEEYIERCLLSIAKQTFTDFEIIIADDCSLDRTVELAQSFLSEQCIKFRILKNEKNLGPSLSRKRGIEQAKGEYIAFCDSDDTYETDYLSSMFAATEEKNDIVFCNYNAVYSNGKIVKHNVTDSICKASKKEILAMANDSLCCMLVRRELFSSLSFPDIRNGEDMAIIPILILKSEHFGFVDLYLYNYIYRAGSLSKKSSEAILNYIQISFEYICEHLGACYPAECEFLGVRNYLYAFILHLFKNKYDLKRAKKILSEFSASYPEWINNIYFEKLPVQKRMYLKAVYKKKFWLCKAMSVIHKIISK